MGEKGNDGGQFLTPREIIRVMIRVVDPEVGKTVYDGGCATCGFLAQSYEYMKAKAERAGEVHQRRALHRLTDPTEHRHFLTQA